MKAKDDIDVRNVIVVLNYNDYNTCIDFLNNTKNYEVFDRIILVDNKSSDNSVKILEQFVDKRIVLLQTNENKGYAYGNNVGMRYAVEHYKNLFSIIISNPDIYISEIDICKIIDKLKSGYGMCTGIIYNVNKITNDKSLASNFGWRLPTYGDMLSNCFLLIYKIKRNILHSSMYLEWEKVKNLSVIDTEAVPGCFFAVSAMAMQKIDYMDEGTFLFGEETILGWRLKHAGFKSCIVNGTVVKHENSVSINKSIKKARSKAKMNLKSDLLYLQKYLKCNRIRLFVYSMFFKVGLFEKRIITWLKSKF